MFEHNDAMLFSGGYMWLLWLIIIIALVYVIKAIFVSDSFSSNKIEDDPMSILMKRYAGGEIDSEEYERIKKTLEGTSK